MKLIQGTDFAALADRFLCTYNGYSLAYSHTHELQNLFNKISKKKNLQYVVISHNSDGCVVGHNPREFDIDYSKMPPNVYRWYAQNVAVNHPRIVPLGIYLENSYNLPELKKLDRIIKKREELDWSKPRKKLVYMNFNINTHIEDRKPVCEYFRQFDWVTVDMHNNGYDYGAYLENLATHKFVICPRGNGLSCHREYEGMYLGCIPILLSSIQIKELRIYMPIYEVNFWSDVKARNLEIFSNQVNRYELAHHQMLDFNYWQKRILNT